MRQKGKAGKYKGVYNKAELKGANYSAAQQPAGRSRQSLEQRNLASPDCSHWWFDADVDPANNARK